MANDIGPEILKSLHTKQLLKALRKSCVAQEQLDARYFEFHDGDPDVARMHNVEPGSYNKDAYYKNHAVAATCFGYDDYIGSTITVADLKAELAIREHVPNKIEAKKIRQEKAKARKNR
jgi:hypothetical protein